MIKKYNQYITESSDNKYSYPYNRIMILISSYQDYLDIINYIEKTFSVNINFFYNMQSPNRVYSHVLLDVDVLYRIMNTYKKDDYVDEDDVIRFYTSRDVHGQDLINEIDADDDYLNKKDVLNINELNSVMNLLLSGRKYSFNEIYQKNRLVYESLLDNLEGPSMEDIISKFNHLSINQQLLTYVKKGEIELIKYAIENGADINYLDINRKITPLSLAVTKSNYDVAQYLLENGAKFGIKNDDIIIHTIDNNPNIDLLKLLIEYGADITTSKSRFLATAAYFGNTEIVDFLLKNNTYNNYEIRTAYHNADGRFHIKTCELLKKYIDNDKEI